MAWEFFRIMEDQSQNISSWKPQNAVTIQVIYVSEAKGWRNGVRAGFRFSFCSRSAKLPFAPMKLFIIVVPITHAKNSHHSIFIYSARTRNFSKAVAAVQYYFDIQMQQRYNN